MSIGCPAVVLAMTIVSYMGFIRIKVAVFTLSRKLLACIYFGTDSQK